MRRIEQAVMSCRIAENLNSVRERIVSAAKVSGRDPGEITLVVVTKTRSVEEIQEAIACGATDIGENYVQEAIEKFEQIGNVPKWHMIGHLQRNKARQAVKFFDCIHSVDNEELARETGRRAVALGRTLEVLVEVNISGEESKSGIEPESALELADRIYPIEGIQVCGFMGMPPVSQNREDTRVYFAKLRDLWEKLPKEQRVHLSMGMTGDFETAIEEGSTMVRIGTAIFGPRQI